MNMSASNIMIDNVKILDKQYQSQQNNQQLAEYEWVSRSFWQALQKVFNGVMQNK